MITGKARVGFDDRPVFEVLEPRLLLNGASPPPLLVDLQPGSDSGMHSDDNITNVAVGTIDITTARTGDTIKIYKAEGQVYLGLASPVSDTLYEYAFTAGQLTEGDNKITARSHDGVTESVDSPALTVTLDTTAPTAVAGSPTPIFTFNTGSLDSVTVTFGEELDFLAGGGGNFWLEDVKVFTADSFLTITDITNIAPATYEIAFDVQTEEGTYGVNVNVYEDIRDVAGNPTSDRYNWSFRAEASRFAATAADADYLIITADEFYNEVQPLAAWKHMKGFKTYVATMSEVGSTCTDVYNYIQTAYLTGPTQTSYVLLVGDHEDVPAYEITGMPGNPSEVWHADYPYACINPEDLLADLAIGRLSAETFVAANPVSAGNLLVRAQVANLLGYDRYPDMGDWYDDALVAGYFQDDNLDGTADALFMETAHRIADFLGGDHDFWPGADPHNQNYAVETVLTQPVLSPSPYAYGAGSYPGRVTPPSPMPASWSGLWDDETTTLANITTAVNDGVGLVVYRGLGSDRSWVHPAFAKSSATGFDNAGKLPVVYSFAGSTGQFDRTDYCLAEAWLSKLQEGAIGVVAPTRGDWPEYTDALAMAVFDGYWDGPAAPNDFDPTWTSELYPASWRPAQGLNRAKQRLLEHYGESEQYARATALMYTWFGDPEMMLRTTTPYSLKVTHPTSVVYGDRTDVTVTVGDGVYAMPGVTVCISRAGSTDYWVDTTDATGSITFDMTTSELGSYDVVAWKHDAVPYKGGLASVLPLAAVGGAADAEYLVITMDAFADEVQALAAWKRMKGFQTHVATMSDVAAATGGTGYNDVYNFIQSAYHYSAPTSYVLLVGDHEDGLPAHEIVGRLSEDPPQIWCGDYAYSCVSGGDLLPDLALGRLPADTEAEAAVMVNKILAYDQTPAMGDWYNDVLAIAELSSSDGTANSPFMETTHRVTDFLAGDYDFWGTEGDPDDPHNKGYAMHDALIVHDAHPTYYYGNLDYLGRETPPSPVPTKWTNLWTDDTTEAKADVFAAVNNDGVGLIVYRDHGGGNVWCAPDFRIGDVESLANTVAQPVVYSIACNTGRFDEEACFAETWLTLDGGGCVGFLGATRESGSRFNDALTVALFDAYWDDFDPTWNDGDPEWAAAGGYPKSWRPAEGLNRANARLLQGYWTTDPDDREWAVATANLYVWFGDPEMMLRTGSPMILDVSHPMDITIGQGGDFTVTVTSGGNPVEGAQVGIAKKKDGGGESPPAQSPVPLGGDGDEDEGTVDYLVGITDEEGMVTFSDTGMLEPGEYTVVITGHNLVPHEGTLEVTGLDFGDAVDPRFPTLLINDGARHVIVEGMRLGGRVDAETDGLQSADAEGDDNDGHDDEDGVTFTSLISPGRTATVDVLASAPGYLNAWIDFGGGGSWNTVGDQIFTSKPLVEGVNSLEFPVPDGAAVDTDVFARFRFASEGTLSFDGLADDGEVEDYLVRIEHAWDFGDAPSTFPTRLIDDGARHIIVDGVYLGGGVDHEDNGRPTTTADGDDNDGNDDEDGIEFLTPIVPGESFTYSVLSSAIGWIEVWFDFNADGDWKDAGEHAFSEYADGVASPMHVTHDSWPADGALGEVYARFRYTLTDLDLEPFDLAPNGEVEDYVVTVVERLDYGDAPAPFPTLLDDDGARHVVVPGFSLSPSTSDPDPDEELDAQPSETAIGDDAQDRDDEDGVTFTNFGGPWLGVPPIPVPGQETPIKVAANIPGGMDGRLDAWMDFNNDGDWKDDGERIFESEVLTSGVNTLFLSTPLWAAQGQDVAARFRLSSTGGLDYTGRADDGEIEDYMFPIAALDFGDAPAPYPTTRTNNGAFHRINPSYYLGWDVDYDQDGQPTPGADGDDMDGNDDEDGVTFTSDLVPGQVATLDVVASTEGYLHAWVDFDDNGSWDPGDQIFSIELLAGGTNNLSFPVPADATPGDTYARFRFVTTIEASTVTPDGYHTDVGEVEDYLVEILEPSAVPDAPDLWADYDKGVLDDDNVTRENTNLTFDVTGTAPGARVILYVDGDEVAAEPATGTTTTLVISETLLDGTYAITATQVEPGKAESLPSPPLMVTVDTVGPTIVDEYPAAGEWINLKPLGGSFDAVRVTFDEAVDYAPGGAGSFWIDDAVVTGPLGPVVVTDVAPTGGIAPNQYDILFAPQSEWGMYDVAVGPTIRDLAGNWMDQNTNDAGGEDPGDIHTWDFEALYADTIFDESTFVGTDLFYDGADQDIIIHDCIVTMDGSHTFNSVRICHNGILTHSLPTVAPDPVVAPPRLSVNTTGNFTIDATSAIDANYLGWAAGPGAGKGDDNGSGASHGGWGGLGSDLQAPGAPYGSMAIPTDLGSGGSHHYANECGGGRVHLNVGGTLLLDGTISADGRTATEYWSAGASGGSVWIQTETLSGTGAITANGGARDGGWAAGGSGGRIAVYYDDASTYTGSYLAAGGAGWQYGAAGTIYLKETGYYGTLIADNDGHFGALTPLEDGWSFQDIIPRRGAEVYVAAGYTVQIEETTLRIEDGGLFQVAGSLESPNAAESYDFDEVVMDTGGQLKLVETVVFTVSGAMTVADGKLHMFDSTSLIVGTGLIVGTSGEFTLDSDVSLTVPQMTIQSGGIVTHSVEVDTFDLRVAGDLLIEAGGMIAADSKGFSGDRAGPGSGWQGDNGSGGSYGGWGGLGSDGLSPGSPYGSIQTPDELGSGGTNGSRGGGRIHLTVGETLTVDGEISADAIKGPSYSGGGSGGCVYLDVGTLSGSGTISANGGEHGRYGDAGGGAGGRIAVHYDDLGMDVDVQAAGGHGNEYGGAGTQYFLQKGQAMGVIVADNEDHSGALTPMPDGLHERDIIPSYGARIHVPTGFSVQIEDPNLDAHSGGSFWIEGSLESANPVGLFDFDLIGVSFGGSVHLLGTAMLTADLVSVSDGELWLWDSTSVIAGTSVAIGSGGKYILDSDVLQVLPAMTVGPGGIVEHSLEIDTFNLHITGDLDVQAGGMIAADSKGFSGDRAGPGSGWQGDNGSGGSYGGWGGLGSDGLSPGSPYGSIQTPDELGSGGTNGSRGGGRIHLTVGETLTVDGEISADAIKGPSYSGGGSGGCVYLDVGTLSGSGTISANGGEHGRYGNAGGGAGGRIAVYYDNIGPFSGDIQAAGGHGNEYGGAGTQYFLQKGQSMGGVVVHNEGNEGALTPMPDGLHEAGITPMQGARVHIPSGFTVQIDGADLTVSNGGAFWIEGSLESPNAGLYDFDDVTVDNGGSLNLMGTAIFSAHIMDVGADGEIWLLDSSSLIAALILTIESGGKYILDSDAPQILERLTVRGVVEHSLEVDTFDLRVARTMIVEAGGLISADGKGFVGDGAGPGSGTGGDNGSGGSYGGWGGLGSDGNPPGGPYGSAEVPNELGSGGTHGSRGGGRIRLTVDTLQLDGEISADAPKGNNYSGGGSGGCVYLDVGTLSGTGAISANGGDLGRYSSGGGGSGGRIALYVDNYAGFDVRNVTVDGGAGHNDGERGTIYPNMIFGTKFDDLDQDGVQDPGETGLAGWTIYVDENNSGGWDPGEQMAVTDEAGEYVVTGLTTGPHTIAEIPQPGWQQTYPTSTIPVTERVNVASDGAEADGMTLDASMSADGRFVAFLSAATNLVPDDTNGMPDIFVHDRWTETTTRVSVASDGSECNYGALGPDISADGRYVAFVSEATDLVAGDTNAVADIFVHDRHTGATMRVSVAGDGTEADDESYFGVSISANGRYVAFSSAATNLVVGDTNDIGDVFVHDCWTGGTERISVSTAADEGDSLSTEPSISADGRHVAFQSHAGNLVGGDTNGVQDIFVHDRTLGATECVSVDGFGTQGNNTSMTPSISAGGQYVAFVSYASNLVVDDENGEVDAFVHNRTTAVTERVSVGSGGTEGSGASDNRSISAAGRYVTFESEAANLVAGDTNGMHDVFVHDRQAWMTQRVSIADDGSEGLGASGQAAISADGRHVAFAANSPNLVPDDANGQWDIFVSANPPAWVPGTHSAYAAPHLLVDGVDFGNIRVNQPPIADANGPYEINLGDDLVLDGSGSTDPDPLDILIYEWDLDDDDYFGDVTGVSPTVLLATLEEMGLGVGTHQVGLRVTDTFGNAAVSTTELNIYDNRPFAAFSMAPPNPLMPDFPITFDAVGSSHGRPDRLIVLYEWDFEGDGIYDDTGQVVTHSYDMLGNYTVVLRVTDDNIPAKTATTSDVVVVEGLRDPVADPGGPYSLEAGDNLALDGSGSYDPDGGDSIVTYEWDVDDDGQFDDATVAAPTISWATLESMGFVIGGLYNIKLRVRDTLGQDDIKATAVTIFAPPPPTVIAFDINDSLPQRSRLNSLALTFDQDVSASLAPTDLSLENTTTSETFSLAGVSLAYVPGANTATWDTSSLFLTDGNYTARLSASGVENASGAQMATDYTFPFHVLMCDLDGDRDVGSTDCVTFVSQFGLRGNGLAADFNNDDRVNLTDFAILRGKMGNTLPAPAPAAAPVAPPAVPVVPVVNQLLDENEDVDDDSIAAAASAAAVDLLAESLLALSGSKGLAGSYISGAPAISGGLSATRLRLAATSAYDLRPLGPSTGLPSTSLRISDRASEDRGVSETDDLLVDVLEEAVSYQLTANSFNCL